MNNFSGELGSRLWIRRSEVKMPSKRPASKRPASAKRAAKRRAAAAEPKTTEDEACREVFLETEDESLGLIFFRDRGRLLISGLQFG